MESDTRHLRELLVRWQAGDRSAADALCRRVARRFVLLTGKMIGRFPNVRVLADTDDMFQDAMLRFLNTLTKLRPATHATSSTCPPSTCDAPCSTYRAGSPRGPT